MNTIRYFVLILSIILCIFSSTHALSQWEQLPGPLSGNITIHQFEFGKRVFVTGSYTSSTSDGGETWSDVLVNGYQVSFLFMTHEEGKLFGAGILGAYVSLDSGNTWLSASNGLPTDQYSQYKTSCGMKTPNSIILGTSFNPMIGTGGFFSSTDFSTSWKALPFHVPLEGVKEVGMYKSVIYTTNGNGITRRSTDMNDWDEPLKIPNSGSANCFKEHNGIFYAGATNGLFKLAADGKSWVRINIGSSILDVRDIYSDGHDMYLATSRGLLFSLDSGTTWIEDTILFPNTNLNSIYISKDYIFAGGFENGTLYCKNRDTQKWTTVTQLSSRPLIYFIGSVEKNLLAASETNLYLSSNKGNDWSTIEWPVTPSFLKQVIQFGSVIVAADLQGIYSSTDEGKTWAINSQNMVTPRGLSYLKSKLFILNGGSVMSSVDSGRTWNTYSYGLTDANIWDIGEYGDSILLIGRNKSFFSTDSGSTWLPANYSDGRQIASCMIYNDVIYLYDYLWDELIQIRRGSTAIEKYSSMNKPYHTPVGGAFFSDDSNVVYISNSKMFITQNDGVTWASFSPPNGLSTGQFRSVAAIDSIVYFASNSGVWKLNPFPLDVYGDGYQTSTINTTVFPNPANFKITVNINVHEPEDILCSICDIAGEHKIAIFSGVLPSGYNELFANVSSLPSGTYYCLIQTKQATSSIPFVLVK